MTFGEPIWFWAFALFPLLIALFFRNEAVRKQTLQKLVAARLLPRLANSASVTKRRVRFLLLLLGLACVIVSMARPRWGFTWQERKTTGRDVIIAIDTSRSMLANDLAPNRITRAKLAAEDLIGQLQGDRVGLIAFAGSAFLQAPLTADHSAVLGALHEIDTEIIPRGGTNIAAAIETAVEAFGKGEGENRALVIFTDGEELDADGIEAAKAQKEIAKIYTIGVGSQEGTVIALPGAGGAYVTDPSGQIVKSKLDEERLQTIAEAGGGFYLHLQNGPAEMRQLVREGIGGMSENEINADVTRQPIERYQWPLGTGMALLCLSLLIGERRRGAAIRAPRAAATAACIAAMLAVATPANANSPRDLYEEGKYSDAQKAYEELIRKNPESDRLAFNHGAAAYKNRDYNTALQAFGKALTTKDPQLRARAEYNIGNTLFQQALGGKKGPDISGLESALAHFDEARKLEPKNEDANYNYEATRQLIERLKQQQQEQEKKEQEKKDQEQKKEDKKDQEKQDQQKSGDQKEQDQQKKEGQQDQEQQSQGKSGENKEKQEGQSGQQDQQGQPDQKDPQGEGKQDMDQDKPGEAGQKPDEQNQKSQDADKQQEGKEGEQPEEQPGEQQQNRKLEGDLKNNPVPGQEAQQSDEQREAAEEALAAAEGRMTESQAKALLDSLKNEDARVQLLDPRDRRRERPSRDW